MKRITIRKHCANACRAVIDGVILQTEIYTHYIDLNACVHFPGDFVRGRLYFRYRTRVFK